MIIDLNKYNLYSKNTRNASNTQGKEDLDKDDLYINDIIKTFSQEESLYEFFRKINRMADLKETAPFQYSIGDTKLLIGSLYNMYPELRGLMTIKDINLSSAPKLVGFSPSKNSKYLIMAVKGVENPVPYKSSKNQVSSAAKLKFINDINKLLNFYIYNPAIDDINNWYFDNHKGLYINSWKDLAYFENDSSMRDFYNRVVQNLGLILY